MQSLLQNYQKSEFRMSSKGLFLHLHLSFSENLEAVSDK